MPETFKTVYKVFVCYKKMWEQNFMSLIDAEIFHLKLSRLHLHLSHIPSHNVHNSKRISYKLLDCHSFENATWYMEHLLKSNYVSFTSCQLQLQSYTPVNEVVKIILRRGLRNVMSHFIHFIFNTTLHQICVHVRAFCLLARNLPYCAIPAFPSSYFHLSSDSCSLLSETCVFICVFKMIERNHF